MTKELNDFALDTTRLAFGIESFTLFRLDFLLD